MYAAETLVGSLSAKSDNSNIRVEWRSLAENQIVKYEIERKSSSGQDFKKIGEESAKGSNYSYTYLDESAYKSSGNQILSNSYSYRLKIVYSNMPETYTSSVDVTHNVSSVKRTWGMLKELFK